MAELTLEKIALEKSEHKKVKTKRELSNQKFLNSFKYLDNLSMVLRLHLHIESMLEEYSSFKLEQPSEIFDSEKSDRGGPSFDMKIRLALALGLDPKLKGPLKRVNRLRNDFAHEDDFEITQDAIKKIYQSFDSQSRRSIDNLSKIHNDTTPRERLSTCMTILQTELNEQLELAEK